MNSLRPKIGLGLGLAPYGLDLGLGIAGMVLCCERRSCHACRHNDLEGHINLSTFGTSLLWRSTEAFTYLKVKLKSAKYHCLLPVVLVLLFWSSS